MGRIIKAKSGKSKKKPKINIMTKRPLRKQVIVFIAKSNTELIVNLAYQHIANINKYLKNIKSDIITDFIRVTNEGVNITMNKLANPSNLTIIEKYIKSISNINLDSIESSCLSKSKLYLKILGLSYTMENSVITPDIVKGVLKDVHLFKDVTLVSKPCIIKVSPKLDMVVVWVDIWDSQSGSEAKNIINWQFNIGWYITTVCSTNMNLGVPQCKNCWKWGHSTLSCHSHISRCAKCYGAHMTEHHKEKAWCCMENKKLSCLATKKGKLCPHTFKCMNCKEDHQVDSYSCPY